MQREFCNNVDVGDDSKCVEFVMIGAQQNSAPGEAVVQWSAFGHGSLGSRVRIPDSH